MRIDATTPIKFLDADGRGPYSWFEWPRPRGKQPGKWVHTSELEMCKRGIHVARGPSALVWIDAKLCTVEVRGSHLIGDDKECWASGRIVSVSQSWNATTQRLFAADCAERALLREREHGREPSEASWRAIYVARQYARGECDDAARDAARDAAWDAAGAAGGEAAGDAARDAECEWQFSRFCEYVNGEIE